MTLAAAVVTPAQAIEDPHLLARGFEGSSWSLWRAILKAALIVWLQIRWGSD